MNRKNMTPKQPQAKRKDTSAPPTRTWKKKYECRKNKGAHTYVLVKDWIGEHYLKNVSVRDYYLKGKPEKLVHIRCTACGHKKIMVMTHDEIMNYPTQDI